MRVKNLLLDVKLHKPYAALDQTTGHQAAPTVGVRRIGADAVSLASRFGFFVEVERVGRLELHVRRKLIAGDARIQFRLVGPLLAVRFIQASQQRSFRFDQRRRNLRARLQVQDRRAFGTESRALIDGRQIGGLPVRDAVDGQALGIVENDVGREISVLSAQTVGDPGADGGPRCDRPAAVDEKQRRLVIGVLAVHRANDGDVVGEFGEMRHQVRD